MQTHHAQDVASVEDLSARSRLGALFMWEWCAVGKPHRAVNAAAFGPSGVRFPSPTLHPRVAEMDRHSPQKGGAKALCGFDSHRADYFMDLGRTWCPRYPEKVEQPVRFRTRPPSCDRTRIGIGTGLRDQLASAYLWVRPPPIALLGAARWDAPETPNLGEPGSSPGAPVLGTPRPRWAAPRLHHLLGR